MKTSDTMEDFIVADGSVQGVFGEEAFQDEQYGRRVGIERRRKKRRKEKKSRWLACRKKQDSVACWG